ISLTFIESLEVPATSDTFPFGETGSNAATAPICSIVLLIFSLPSLEKPSRRVGAFVKDYVPCLSMPRRHTFEADGASAPTLFRCRGGDGKCLTSSNTEAACCPAVVEQTDPRPRGRGRCTAIRSHRQIRPPDRRRPCFPGGGSRNSETC